ncbi:MAG TPA: YfhO family protein, partial [Planctomycetota bacterium]|nr:YfhO family protein [Planctomycetota bacterium]
SANTCYLGALAMLAAACSFFFLKRSRPARFFAPAAVLWFLYAYDVAGIGKWLGSIPTIDLAPINRSQPIGLFALSACAALAVDAIARSDVAARWKYALATLLFGSFAMWFTLVFESGKIRGAWKLFSVIRKSGYAKALPPGAEAYVPHHFQFILLTYAAGLLALVALWFARARPVKLAAQLVILAAVFLQSGWLLRDYNPTSEDRLVYPVTPAIEALQRNTAGEPVVVLGSPDTLPPHLNLVYGLNTLSSYDAMWVRRYDELYRESFGLGGGNWRMALQTTARWMRRFGARFVASPGNWVKVESLGDRVLISQDDLYLTPPILPGSELVQTFTGARERLQGIALQFATTPRPVECTIEARLEDSLTGHVVATKTWHTGAWKNDRFGRHEELFDFEPMIDARHRPLRLTLASPDATAGNAIALWARKDYWYWNEFVLFAEPLHEVVWTLERMRGRPGRRPHGRLTVGESSLAGGLVMDQTYTQDEWEKVEELPGFTLATLADPLPRYTTVSRAIVPRKVGDDFRLVHAGQLDPRHVVVLSSPGRAAIDSTRGVEEKPEPAVEVLRDDPDHAQLRVTREKPGYLVLRRTFFPGWRASVNGQDAPLLRADYAFCAVELPAGESTVELAYRPMSFRLGVWIAALVPLLGAGALWLTRARGTIAPWSVRSAVR